MRFLDKIEKDAKENYTRFLNELNVYKLSTNRLGYCVDLLYLITSHKYYSSDPQSVGKNPLKHLDKLAPLAGYENAIKFYDKHINNKDKINLLDVCEFLEEAGFKDLAKKTYKKCRRLNPKDPYPKKRLEEIEFEEELEEL